MLSSSRKKKLYLKYILHKNIEILDSPLPLSALEAEYSTL